MPLQNRVDPYGSLFRTPARGTFMGNRGGPLHDRNREIVRPFKNRRWIACLLEFRSRRRSVMTPGRYTELFFLDEAVALAAGHRPCAQCRRERFNAFRAAWTSASGAAVLPPAPEIDSALHLSRIDAHGNRLTYSAVLDSLPDGCFVELDGSAHLLWNHALHRWTPEGYTQRCYTQQCYSQQRPLPRGSAQPPSAWCAVPRNMTVTVLTPAPIVECFRRGYRPEIHKSAR